MPIAVIIGVPSAARTRILLAAGAIGTGAQLAPPSRVSNPPAAVPTQPTRSEAKPMPNYRALALTTSGNSRHVSPPSVVFTTTCCSRAGS